MILIRHVDLSHSSKLGIGSDIEIVKIAVKKVAFQVIIYISMLNIYKVGKISAMPIKVAFTTRYLLTLRLVMQFSRYNH